MLITHLRTNHLENPLGYAMDKAILTWEVSESTGKKQTAARVLVALSEDFAQPCYDSAKSESLSSLGFRLPIELKAYTRYYWKVTVWADDADEGESAPAWFETAKQDEPWQAAWLSTPFGEEEHPFFRKAFSITKPIASARVYATGLGVYELEINGQKSGEECLAPFYNGYDNWVQYQTYDIADQLSMGENVVGAMLGNGWYKGRFGFVADMKNLYGTRFLFLAELRIVYQDGSCETIGTGADWLCAKSPVTESSIYDGEYYDARLEIPGWSQPGGGDDAFVPAVVLPEEKWNLMARLSPPVKVIERRPAVTLLRTPAGEDVLDFGQLVTGWVEFNCALPAGQELFLQFGELLQHDNFYTENLRSAKQELRFISRGDSRVHRPRFTFYGFRFIKVTGLETVNPADFTACVIHTEMEFTGQLETSNPKVNQLISNALWGQRGNFLDVPTDCPQRDERMGWTGDAQVFAATASFNMYTPAFFKKFLYDMLEEQKKSDGAVPHVVPDILSAVTRQTHKEHMDNNGSCAWGDAATVIPWTMYQFYGDREMLASQYDNMQLWVEFIKKQDDQQCGGSRLWTCGFHFADWLALDNPDHSSSFGRTDPYYVASCYYYYSTTLLAKAAKVLGKKDDQKRYETLAEEVRAAIHREYFTPTGRLAVETTTAAVLTLAFGLAPVEHHARTVESLRSHLEANNNHLDTGFVGTAYLCPVLSANGLSEYAYTLLFNEDYPSWLYEVNMGATTVWERWNSVLPNGLVSDTGMNSMNHYAYGSIVEWMYRYMCGLNPSEDVPGFKRAVIRPMPDQRLESASATYRSAAGLYKSGWERIADKTVYRIVIPFDAQAEFILPAAAQAVLVNGAPSGELQSTGKILLDAGTYEIHVK